MWRSLRHCAFKRKQLPMVFIQHKTFLTNDYQCTEAWNSLKTSSIYNQINLNDFYNIIDQNYSSKGVISPIDVDIFAGAINDAFHLEELKDLLHKLRLSAETGNMLESTHQATIRNYLQFGNTEDLLSILKDPLNFGVFLDEFTANILLDKLVTSSNFEQAANVAALIMLQEEYENEISNALCQYACYKYVMNYSRPEEPQVVEDKKKKVDEIKIRVKFLRNPYFDDHFDIKDVFTLSGKTLAWISERKVDNTNLNLQIIGWLIYKKYDKLLHLCNTNAKNESFKTFPELIDLFKKEINFADQDSKSKLEACISILENVNQVDLSLEECIKNSIENAINKSQTRDIESQKQIFQSWREIREKKLEEQTKRLDRAKRIEAINYKQKDLQVEEQKLWFFENEEAIDLEIEEKEQTTRSNSKKKSIKAVDEDYIPPEILPKRK
ncbi:uncharacterized protein LOC135073275 [Ostrinia nubilalis]|uniref:uncharacterized protein LOC135073275 n=1 Tax=Ostrinia nubilalis TaxID=29057 RepID=UPI0030824065